MENDNMTAEDTAQETTQTEPTQEQEPQEPEPKAAEEPGVDWEARAKEQAQRADDLEKRFTTLLDSVNRLVESGLTFGGMTEPQTRTPKEKTPSEKALDTIYEGIK